MAELYQQKYRIASARHPTWEYTSPGYYFVTICTGRRIHYFGNVVNGDMILSQAGQIVADEWNKTEHIRSRVTLDAWVVMPNHMHGIVVILTDELSTNNVSTQTGRDEAPPRLYDEKIKNQRISPRPNSLGAIIGQFKSKCTKRIRQAGVPQFSWQPRYHDHIIRNDRALQRIRQYIRCNPANWQTDRFYK